MVKLCRNFKKHPTRMNGQMRDFRRKNIEYENLALNCTEFLYGRTVVPQRLCN